MSRYTSLHLTLALGAFTITGCDHASPTEQSSVVDRVPTGVSAALVSNTWTPRAPIPGVWRYELNAETVTNAAGQSIVFVLGGLLRQPPADPDPPATSILTYNVATNTWATEPGQLKAAFSNGIGRIGNRLYIAGGRDFTGSEDDLGRQSKRLIAYDVTTGRTVRRADMPVGSGLGVTGVINNKLYVLAGVCLSSLCSRLYRYDPVSNSWTLLSPSPNTHAQGAGAVIGGKFYVAGGDLRSSQGALDVYDPVTNAWKSLSPLLRRPQPVGANLNGKFYVIGGIRDRTTLAYNPVKAIWLTRAPFPQGELEHLLGFPYAAVRVTVDGTARILTLGSSMLDGADAIAGPSWLYTP
jgi:hypothetical protein